MHIACGSRIGGLKREGRKRPNPWPLLYDHSGKCIKPQNSSFQRFAAFFVVIPANAAAATDRGLFENPSQCAGAPKPANASENRESPCQTAAFLFKRPLMQSIGLRCPFPRDKKRRRISVAILVNLFMPFILKRLSAADQSLRSVYRVTSPEPWLAESTL